MRVLWLNWRDIKNPVSGGAEVYTHEVARRLVGWGHDVTLFSSCFSGCVEEEDLDGVRVVRSGGKFTVYLDANKYYRKRFSRESFEVVVDEINTRPFLAPKFADGGERVIALIHQLAREFWFYETPFPISLIGYYYLEKRWLENYTDIPTVAVSDSTKKDLEDLGFKKVFVVHNGLNVEPVDEIPEKNEEPTIVFVGRMKRAKKPQDAIEAFKIVRKKIRDVELWMVGDGYLRSRLESGTDGVKFFGYVDNETRNELVRRAWVIAVPGVREGWGQVVTDANALGTPAVGYDIPGLRDSIRDGYNGILVECNPEALAAGIVKVLSDNELRESLSRKAIEWASHFSWDRTAEEFMEVVDRSVGE